MTFDQVAKVLGHGWAEQLWEEFNMPYMKKLSAIIKRDRKRADIYPPGDKVFRAFQLTPFEKVKVVIIGQDPYATPGVANGLAFSASPRTDKEDINYMPPSLKNIFQEVEDDMGMILYQDPSLERWAEQGVFLLNTTLTVRKSKYGSHFGLGWETFTKKALQAIGDSERRIVFMFWGSNARAMKYHIDPMSNRFLEAAHPSPRSAHRGFFGCRHFSKANAILEEEGYEPIKW